MAGAGCPYFVPANFATEGASNDLQVGERPVIAGHVEMPSANGPPFWGRRPASSSKWDRVTKLAGDVYLDVASGHFVPSRDRETRSRHCAVCPRWHIGSRKLHDWQIARSFFRSPSPRST